jgi:hypothetical protein
MAQLTDALLKLSVENVPKNEITWNHECSQQVYKTWYHKKKAHVHQKTPGVKLRQSNSAAEEEVTGTYMEWQNGNGTF